MTIGRTHIIPAVLAALAIAVVVVIPGSCAAADHAADHTGAHQHSDQHAQHHHDRQSDLCEWLCSLGASPTTAAVHSTEQLDEPQSLDFWWSPQLVATLWLIDRLAEATPPATPAQPPPTDLRADQSNTYLTHSTLLI